MTEMRAKVISQERDLYRVNSDKGEIFAEVSGKFRYDAVTVSDFPAVGDYVLVNWPEDESNGVITALFARKNCFVRKAAGKEHREQVVAANVDYVFICMSLNNDYNLRRLERYLSIAWDSGSSPVVVLTKADLCDDVALKITEVEQIAIGADVIAVSSYLNDLDQIYQYVKPGKTVAFLGSSGVGKSTLINRLVGEDVIEELADKCKFRDCTHTGEPGCVVCKAIEDGTLDLERFESYLKLKKENAFAADGSSYLEAKKQKFKEISKINNHAKRRKMKK